MENKKQVIGITVLIILLLIAAGYAVIHTQNKKNIGNKIIGVEQKIPNYFLASSTKVSLTTAEDTKNLFVTKSELFEQGITYEIPKPLMQASSELFDTMVKNGWFSVPGSTQTENQSIRKVRKGNDFLYIVLEKKTSNTTIVKIIPIKTK